MLLNKQETRELVNKTVEEVTSAICSTMGPDGKVVLCDNSQVPAPTKDGSTVAKAMNLEDPKGNLIAKMISQSCSRTDNECGDGTTTTAFLLNQFYFKFFEQCNFKTKRRLNQLTKETIALLKERSREVTIDDPLLKKVMLITSNGDEEMVDFVIDIYRNNPHLPDFVLREGKDETDSVQDNGDCSWPANYGHPALSPNGNGASLASENYVPIVFSGELTIDSKEEIENFFKNMNSINIDEKDGKLPVIFLISRGINQKAIETISVYNNSAGYLKVVPISVKASGSSGIGIMSDIATSLGRTLRPTLSFDLPEYRETYEVGARLIVSNGRLNLSGINHLHEERISIAIANVKNELDSLTPEQRNAAVGQIVRSRYSIVSGGDITVYVGGVTAVDIKERLTRLQDVGRVCQSALRSGVLEGCGYTLGKVGDVIATLYPEDSLAQEYADVLRAQAIFLMGEWEEGMVFTNLATGEEGSRPSEIGVWDAALATITAVEAGMNIAMLLMDTSHIIMNAKTADVQISR